jgi:uncharacterized protein
MTKQSYFSPGQTIVLREIWQGRVWSARPVIIVQDKPELRALYMPSGTIWKQPVNLEGKRVTAGNRARAEWKLKEDKWNPCSLRLMIPGANYSVLLFWNYPEMSHEIWYINIEDPLCYTALGFDYLDQFLDAIVKPDLSSWCWKDEDELAEAVELGLISKQRAAALYAEGEKVANWIQSGNSPFNGWENWRPDPSWQIPVLLDGWDKA